MELFKDNASILFKNTVSPLVILLQIACLEIVVFLSFAISIAQILKEGVLSLCTRLNKPDIIAFGVIFLGFRLRNWLSRANLLKGISLNLFIIAESFGLFDFMVFAFFPLFKGNFL